MFYNTQIVIQVYYVSRTHTQLSQFIQEMSKTSFAVSNCDAEFLEKESKNPSTLRVIPLASRQVMCINESVRKASRFGQCDYTSISTCQIYDLLGKIPDPG